MTSRLLVFLPQLEVYSFVSDLYIISFLSALVPYCSLSLTLSWFSSIFYYTDGIFYAPLSCKRCRQTLTASWMLLNLIYVFLLCLPVLFIPYLILGMKGMYLLNIFHACYLPNPACNGLCSHVVTDDVYTLSSCLCNSIA